MTHFYLLPIEHVGRARGPRYLQWRHAPGGLPARWSLKDFGQAHDIALVATPIALHAPDVIELPWTWSARDRDRVCGMLRAAGIEQRWLMRADNWREAWQRLAGLTQAYQSPVEHDPAAWLGRDVHFGFATLSHLDEQMHDTEQAALRECVVEALRVTWDAHPPRFNWRGVLRQAALMPLWLLLGALPASDAFTGNDGTALTTYSASWTYNTGSLVLLSNAARGNTTSYNVAHWNADAFADAQYSQAVRTGTGTGYTGVSLRCHASTVNCYLHDGSTTTSELIKLIDGSETSIASGGGGIAAGVTVRLEANGTTLTPKFNGSVTNTVGAQTDSAHTSGSAGIYIWSSATDNLLDTWEGGNLVTTTSVQLATRARNDDGNESAATTIADGNFTAPLDTNVRIRVQVDTAGDLASTAFQLEAQKSGDQVWTAVTT